MATERIDIVIREDGARVVNRDLDRIGETAERSSKGVNLLRSALAAMAAYLAVDRVVKWADSWATASSQIRIATKSAAEAAAVQEKLFASAQQTRQGFEGVVELYSRTARAGKALGASQQQIIDFSTSIGKALAVQGGSAESSRGALLQLGQALAGGTVRAEEFNSIIEGAPYLLQVVANNIKGVDGDLGTLRDKMLAGQLSSKLFFEAFQKGAGDIDKDFAKAALTIGQSMTVVNNALMRYVGQLDQTLGVSAAVGVAAKFIADNMEQIGAVAVSLGAALAAAFAPGVVMRLMSAIGALFGLIAAHPFVALGAAVIATSTYLYQFRDAINAGVDDVTTLGDVGRAVLAQLGTLFDKFGTWAAGAWERVVRAANTAYERVTSDTDSAVMTWAASFSQFYSGVGTGFAGVVKAVARTIDAILGLITGLVIANARVIANIPTAFKTFFGNAYNDVLGIVEKMINVVVDGMNVIRKAAGQDLMETFTLSAQKLDVTPYKEIGADIAGAFDAGFRAQGGFVEKWVDSTFGQAAKIAQDRIADAGTKGAADLNKSPGAGKGPRVDEKATKAAQAYENALTQLLNTIAPLDGAERELAQAQAILNKGLATGKINAADYARYQALLKDHYRDLLDPLGAVNREVDRQVALLGMEANARQVAEQVYQTTQDLKSKGIQLTQEETAAMTAQFAALQKLTEATQARDSLVAATQGQRQQFSATAGALGSAQKGQVPGVTTGDVAQQVNGMAPDLFAGSDTAMQAQVAAAQEMYDKLNELRKNDLISEETLQLAKTRIALEQQDMRLANTNAFFGTLAGLQESSNKELAAIGKAAAIAQATMDGIVAVQKALASGPPPYNYAMAAAVGVSAAANVAKLAGFESGGYTGNVGTSEIAGVVHGREFVVNAEGTARNRAALEAMNSGASLPLNGGAGPTVVVNVVNNSSGTTVKQEERETPNGRELTVMIEDVVATSVRKGGRVADAMEGQYGLNRALGAAR